jgi:hypothetical protein
MSLSREQVRILNSINKWDHKLNPDNNKDTQLIRNWYPQTVLKAREPTLLILIEYGFIETKIIDDIPFFRYTGQRYIDIHTKRFGNVKEKKL